MPRRRAVLLPALALALARAGAGSGSAPAIAEPRDGTGRGEASVPPRREEPRALRGKQTVDGATDKLPRRVAAAVPSVSQLQWADANQQGGEIGGGVVSWTPPADVSSIDAYQVYIAHDSLGAYQAQLWWSNSQTEEFSSDFPVGTNSFTLFEPTRRQTTNSAYPANWLLVYSKSGGLLQATADAAKIPIYDISASAPSFVDLIVDTSATYLTGSSTVAGTVQWSPADFADLGFLEHYSVYVAPASGDTGNEVGVQDVPLGTNELALAGSKTCAEGSYLAVYAKNPNGRASSASWQSLQACPVSTLVATTAVPTTTTTVALASGTLVFSDTNSEADQIGGAVIQWSPTTDTTATHYQVYIANDDQGSYKAQLWHADPTTEDVMNAVPVGTNEFHVFDPTARRTTDNTYPANWVFLFTSSSGSLQDVGNALKVRLYDLSTSVPSYVPMDWLTVIDIDWTDERVVGSVQWSVSAQADVALATEFSVYMARDAAGTGEAYIQSASVGTNRILFSADCWDRNYMLVYANNPNGRATQAASTMVTGCTTAMPAGDPTTTTVVTTEVVTTTTSSPTLVSSVQFTDYNMEANQIGGSIVQWVPAADSSSVSGYQVHIANDESGSHKVSLWYSDPYTETLDNHFPVGTNKFWIFEPTVRATADPAYPANWVIVFSVDTSGAVQVVEDAVKVPLYDVSSSTPGSPSLVVDSSGTYLSGGEIAGSVRWSVASAQDDLGLTEHLAVYLAADASGNGQVSVLNASRASDTFTLPGGHTCASGSYLGVYAENPNGKALAASWQLLAACAATTSTMQPTTTTTTTAGPWTGQTTTTAAPLATRVSGLTFTDNNPTRSEIGGAIVSWIPPSDVSNVVRYDAYISYDSQGSYEAQLWWENADTGEIGRGVPVGTNQITLFHSTTRRTMRSGYPATYLIVYTHDGSTRQDVDDATLIPIYDDSGSRPFPVFFEWIRFSDMDWTDERIFGMLDWKPTSLSDLALATDYAIYLSQNTFGNGKVQIASTPIGTTQLWVPYGTYCWDYKYILVYASNPYGEAFFGASTYLNGCDVPAPTTTATTTTTTVTTTTVSTVTGQTTETASTSTASTSTVTITTTLEPWLMSNLVFTDTNTEADQIGGATIQWTPPSDTSTITSYGVYIAYDDLGSHQVPLWYLDPVTEQLGFEFPVGTNSFNIFSPTARQTADPSYPANWVLVYTLSGSTLQSVSDAAKVRLYDASTNVPGSLFLTLDFTDQDAADATIAGTLKWTLPTTTLDLGFTSHYAVYLASSATGTGRTSLLSVPVGTNEVEIPSGTACWSNNYLLVYASNPNGTAATASSMVLSGCTTPSPTP